MGSRACMVFTDGRDDSPAIHLHWNGGPESIYAFLDAPKRYDALGDPARAAARSTQLVGNYLGCSLSLALFNVNGPLPADLDPEDNGIYLIALRRDFYTMRRWIDGVERDAQIVERERAEAYRDRCRTVRPTIDEQIDQFNQAHFERHNEAARRAANDHVGG